MKDTIYMMPPAAAFSIKDWIGIIPAMTGIVVAFWGIDVYRKQQKYIRLQNLSKLFQRFTDDPDFMHVFTCCDTAYPVYNKEQMDIIRAISEKEKLKYLGLLEDVALHAGYNEVNKNQAVHLFQWHFYYIYNDLKIAEAFWDVLGGLPDEKSWKMQMDFSKACKPL